MTTSLSLPFMKRRKILPRNCIIHDSSKAQKIFTEQTHEDPETKKQIQEIMSQAERYKKQGNVTQFIEYIERKKPFLSLLGKTKAASVLSSIVGLFLEMNTSTSTKLQLCKDYIQWASSIRMNLLKRSLEMKLLGLYFDLGMYAEALKLDTDMFDEFKQIDDKNSMVEIKLLESKMCYALGKIAEARSALTSSRIMANLIFCQPALLGSLDLQSGILYAAEKNYKTAFTYFCEAFETFDNSQSPKAPVALKYMVLMTLLLDNPPKIKNYLTKKYSDTNIDALRALSQASQKRSLVSYNSALKRYKKELKDDIIIKTHLDTLYDSVFEQNLLKIAESYSKVPTEYISKVLRTPKDEVEKKLQQMIIDKKFSGSLKQKKGFLVVYKSHKTKMAYWKA